jgi:hypothetical protein
MVVIAFELFNALLIDNHLFSMVINTI